MPTPRRRLKFIDESGVNLAMTRRFGRAPRGERVADAVPRNHGRTVTVMGALSCHGLDAVLTIEGAPDAAVFRAYVEPGLMPDDIVVLDNPGAHKVAGIREAIEGAGAPPRYLPPYSPDDSPIKACRSKLKTVWRAAKARTRDGAPTRGTCWGAPALDAALKAALDTVTVADARSGFQHRGYAVH
jgi:transposase